MKLIFVLMIFTHLAHAKALTMKINFIASTNIPGMDIKGQVKDKIIQNVEMDKNSIKKLSIKLMPKQFTTGLELRDEHLHDFLKSSVLEFQNTSVCTFRNSVCDMTGTLSIAGKKVLMQVKVQEEEKLLRSQLKLKLSQFELEQPSFAGVSVNDVILINIEGIKK